MAVINTTRNFTTVFETMVEYALFPPAAEYTTFPDSAFAAGQRFKGRRVFEQQGAHGNMPWILWFLNDAPDIEDDACQEEAITGIVTVMVAHSHPDLMLAAQRVTRDLGLVKEVCKAQEKAGTALPSGPFFIGNTSVVPASFGTVHLAEVVPPFINVAVRPTPELGPTIVTGGCGVVIRLLVDAN